jgi:hypothetical protein
MLFILLCCGSSVYGQPGQAHHTAHAKFGADVKISHEPICWVQSSTFWDHVNTVDIVMQVIGILSS